VAVASRSVVRSGVSDGSDPRHWIWTVRREAPPSPTGCPLTATRGSRGGPPATSAPAPSAALSGGFGWSAASAPSAAGGGAAPAAAPSPAAGAWCASGDATAAEVGSGVSECRPSSSCGPAAGGAELGSDGRLGHSASGRGGSDVSTGATGGSLGAAGGFWGCGSKTTGNGSGMIGPSSSATSCFTACTAGGGATGLGNKVTWPDATMSAFLISSRLAPCAALLNCDRNTVSLFCHHPGSFRSACATANTFVCTYASSSCANASSSGERRAPINTLIACWRSVPGSWKRPKRSTNRSNAICARSLVSNRAVSILPRRVMTSGCNDPRPHGRSSGT